MHKLQEVECFLLDMDGTIYLSDKLIDGTLDFLNSLKQQNKRYIFLTNNSSKNRLNYCEKLQKLGIVADVDEIFTSGEATTRYLSLINANAKIFLIGNKNLVKEFKDAGFEVVNESSGSPDYVVLGFDTELTYEKIHRACDFIRSGVKLIVTHPDLNCPLAGGNYMPDAGAMLQMILASCGPVDYQVIGKPNVNLIEQVCLKYHLDRSKIAMVGDRLYTDIKIGNDAKITSVLVLSGETKLEDLDSSKVKPTLIFNSIKEMIEEL